MRKDFEKFKKEVAEKKDMDSVKKKLEQMRKAVVPKKSFKM